MFPWSFGEKLIFLEFLRFSMKSERGQNMVSTAQKGTFTKEDEL